MADDFLKFQDPATVDRKLDAESLTVGANTVYRERVQLAGATATAIARILNGAPSAADFRLLNSLIGMYTPNGDTLINDVNDCLKVELVNDLAGSAVDADDGSIAAGQSNVALTLALQYGWNGSAWVRISRADPLIVHNNHQTTGTTTGVNVTTSAAQVLASNANRKGVLFHNISDTRILIRFNTAPDATSGAEIGIPLEANGDRIVFGSLIDTRAVQAIHGGSGNKRLLITEW